MKVLGLASLLAAVTIADWANAQEPAPPVVIEPSVIEEPPLIADPVWIVGPTDFDRAPFYPPELTAGEALAVEVECGVLPNGNLGRCGPVGDAEAARPFMLASLRVLLNLRLAVPPASEGEIASDPMAVATPAPVRHVGRVRLVLDWTPPADPVAATARYSPPVVTDVPGWQTGGSDYPERALSRGIESGRVQVMCVARSSGSLESCSILREEPAGAGFGSSALRTVRRKQVAPAMVDGRPIDDLIATVVNFRLETAEEEAARQARQAAEAAVE